MARPKKQIPLEDVKGIKTLLEEGKTQSEIAKYYNVAQSTVSEHIKRIKLLP